MHNPTYPVDPTGNLELSTMIGAISHGTLRIEDLLPAFYDALSIHAPESAREHTREFPFPYPEHDDPWWDSEEASAELEALTERLGEASLPYCYFGAHSGDASDFGWWLDEDAIRDDVHDGTALEVSSLPSILVHTNDHGNVVVYRVELTPILETV